METKGNKTKIITRTLPQLSEELGIPPQGEICAECGRQMVVQHTKNEGGEIGCLFYRCFCKYTTRILSVGDKYPMDECATCGHKIEDANGEFGLPHSWRHVVYVADPTFYKHHQGTGMVAKLDRFCAHDCGCDTPKPLLAKVKGIQLTERCECGLPKEHSDHYDEFEVDEHERSVFVGKSHEFKPVQMVEIEVEE